MFKSFEMYLAESTSDEETFIKSIFDNPFDTITMLVYADWLDDHDDNFSKFIRAAVASANPENHKNKDPHQEPFFGLIKREFATDRHSFNALPIDWKKGCFYYRDKDYTQIKTVIVLPTGQIAIREDEYFQPISIEDIKPLPAKRSTLLLLLEQMVDSHRIKNPHGHHSEYRPKNRQGHTVESNWADHALHATLSMLQWYRDEAINHYPIDEEEVTRMFLISINHYLKPLEKMTRDIKFIGDWQNLTALSQQAIERAREHNVNEKFIKEFQDLVEKILQRIHI